MPFLSHLPISSLIWKHSSHFFRGFFHSSLKPHFNPPIYVTHSSEGEGLLFYGNVILPFIDRFPKDTELYRIMTTKPQEVSG